jgi:hypothetical protein
MVMACEIMAYQLTKIAGSSVAKMAWHGETGANGDVSGIGISWRRGVAASNKYIESINNDGGGA